MNETVEIISINEKKEYHNCEMLFSFFNDNAKSNFQVDQEQKYSIHTTIKEVEVLNEALNVFQNKGFKDNFLNYTSVVDGSQQYPEFVVDYIAAVDLAKELQSLANDEDSLVQLSEYCMETPPTYEDDFRINKQIVSITIDSQTRDINGYEDLKKYLQEIL